MIETFFTEHWAVVVVIVGLLWAAFLLVIKLLYSFLGTKYAEFMKEHGEMMGRIEALERVTAKLLEAPEQLHELVQAVNQMKLDISHRLTAVETKFDILVKRDNI